LIHLKVERRAGVVGQFECGGLRVIYPVIYWEMTHSTLELIRSHVASGAALMAREKQIIAELKERGMDSTEAERTLAHLSACLRVFEEQWLALLKEQNDANNV
jgi:hypothetical protein